MKKLLLLSVLSLLNSETFAQVYVEETNVLVEDKSVEAVKEYWSQKRHSEAVARIQDARRARISSWVDKPFSSSLSQYKYIILLPPRKHHKDIKRNLKIYLIGLPLEFVFVQEAYKSDN